MVISRTPFRISFFGGGTDYPAWYTVNGGEVLAGTIDKFCYINCRYLPPFFQHRTRVVYSRIENVHCLEDIEHPSVRETLRFMNITKGLEIHHDGDLPARSGMGSSSSFTVGLLHALYALKGRMPGKQALAEQSIHIEQDLIKETVGSQDQISAAYGGLNHITFGTTCSGHPGRGFRVRPVTVHPERLTELSAHLMLFYTGIVRTASHIAQGYMVNLHQKGSIYARLSEMVQEGLSILTNKTDINEFGLLLDEAWRCKRSLANNVTSTAVDALFELAKSRGALGGKLLGAGGGGFLLLFVPPHARDLVREALHDLIHVPFAFENQGSQIIYYNPQARDYASAEEDRNGRVIRCFREIDCQDVNN